jgi:transaldolase
MLNEGSIRTAIEETGIRGLTSNPTIFEKAIAAGSAYDEEIGGLLERDLDAHAIFETVAVRDIQGATDLFRTIYESSRAVTDSSRSKSLPWPRATLPSPRPMPVGSGQPLTGRT